MLSWSDLDNKMNIETERLRTRPDYTAYVPKSLDGSTHDTGNEHFLVFESPDGGLAAVWTQSTAEGEAATSASCSLAAMMKDAVGLRRA